MSTAPSIFGRVVAGSDVEEACMGVLKRWTSTYLSEVERQHGLIAGAIPRPRSWTVAPSLDKYPEDQVPALLLISVGLQPPPSRDAGGVYRARWLMGLGIVFSARTQAESHRIAELYLSALRLTLLQRQSLDGFDSDGTDWLDEQYGPDAYDDARSLGWGTAQFTVEVADVATVYAGPTTPDAPLTDATLPWPDDPTVQTVAVEVAKLAAAGGTKGEK